MGQAMTTTRPSAEEAERELEVILLSYKVDADLERISGIKTIEQSTGKELSITDLMKRSILAWHTAHRPAQVSVISRKDIETVFFKNGLDWDYKAAKVA